MKHVPLDDELIQSIADGAAFCNRLKAIDLAYMVEDQADLSGLLDGVDPELLFVTAQRLQAIAVLATFLPDVGSEPQSTERSPLRAIDSSAADQASEPITFSVRV